MRGVLPSAKEISGEQPKTHRLAVSTCPEKSAADTAAATEVPELVFSVAEKTAAADDLGNLRRDRLVPVFVAAGDALEDVS